MPSASKSYATMITEAIVALKDRTGSSSAAIKKYILANNKGLDFKQHFLTAALKRGVEGNTFNKIKSSYKLVAKPKVAKKKPAKKPGKFIIVIIIIK